MILENKKDLINYLDSLSKENSIGVITGSFDLLHDGHKYALDYSSKLVDKLIVLVNSDETIYIYKGKNRPIESFEKRIKNLEEYNNNLIYVELDEVIPNNLLKIIKPNKYFISKEWSSNPAEKIELIDFSTEIIEHPELEGFSSSKIVEEKIMTKFKDDKAIFLDRDGTINEDKGYINSSEDIEIKEINLKGIREMSKLKYKNIIVSNQSGISRGYFTESDLKKVNNRVIELIKENGGRIDQIYFDTSLPENPSNFRKPNNGMLLRAIEEFNIVLKDSWLIGDKDTDVELAKKNNIKSIYIKNEKYEYNSRFIYDYSVNDLYEAFKIILEFDKSY